jgi:hypothetical protein
MPGAVQPDEQLEWERRAGRVAGIAALIAGAMLLLQLFYPALVGATLDSAREFERYTRFNDQPDLIYVPYLMQAIGYLAAAVAFWYLAKATFARRTQMGRPMQVMAVLGPVANALAAVLLMIAVLGVAGKVDDLNLPDGVTNAAAGLPGLAANYVVAEDAVRDLQTDDALFTIAAYVDLTANLALGFGLVLVGLNAMRAGLLSRFLGILGIIVGVLTVLFRGAGIIEAFWLIALGALFLDRWPNGRGPAWGQVEAIPWPSAVEQRAAAEAEEDDEDEDEDIDEDEYADDRAPEELEAGDEPELEEEPAGEPHPASKKRKKKKRR